MVARCTVHTLLLNCTRACIITASGASFRWRRELKFMYSVWYLTLPDWDMMHQLSCQSLGKIHDSVGVSRQLFAHITWLSCLLYRYNQWLIIAITPVSRCSSSELNLNGLKR
jgi:hypothetical protein